MKYKNIYITLVSQFCVFVLTVETDYDIAITRDAQSFQKDRSHLKIQGGTTKETVFTAAWFLGFLLSCLVP